MCVKKVLRAFFFFFLTSLDGVPLLTHRAAFVRGILYGSPRKDLSGQALSTIVCTCA